MGQATQIKVGLRSEPELRRLARALLRTAQVQIQQTEVPSKPAAGDAA